MAYNLSENFVVCPYNKSHIILRRRLPYHLIKCARTSVEVKKFTSCQYNHCHKFRRGEGVEHYNNCADREVEEYRLQKSRECVRNGNTSLPKYEDLEIEGENWEDELQEPFL